MYVMLFVHSQMEGGNRPHKLKQFHFTAWPDHGVPDYATPMLAFHRRIISTHNSRRGPMMVHCRSVLDDNSVYHSCGLVACWEL